MQVATSPRRMRGRVPIVVRFVPKAEVIKLEIDIHKRQYVVVQQVEGEGPKAP